MLYCVSIEVVMKIYDMPNAIFVRYDSETAANITKLNLDEYIQTLGFESCKFNSGDGYWVMSEVDYTMFCLRFA